MTSILYWIKQDTSRLREYKYKQESPEMWVIMDDLDDIKEILNGPDSSVSFKEKFDNAYLQRKEKSWN